MKFRLILTQVFRAVCRMADVVSVCNGDFAKAMAKQRQMCKSNQTLINGIGCHVPDPYVPNHPKCINWRHGEHGGTTPAANRTLPARRSCRRVPTESLRPAGRLDTPLIR